MGGKFNHIKIPPQWKPYWDTYPEGYTILEALIHWVNQVNRMVDNLNGLNIKLDREIKRIEDKKTDLTGDHKGTWQGFKPSQVDPALNSIIEKQQGQINELERIITIKQFLLQKHVPQNVPENQLWVQIVHQVEEGGA